MCKIKVGVFSSYYPTYRDAVFAEMSKSTVFQFSFLAGAPPSGSFIVDNKSKPYTFSPIKWFTIPIPGTHNSISYRSKAILSILLRQYDVIILSNDILGIDVWFCCFLGRLLRIPVCIWGQGMSRPASIFRDGLRWLLTSLASASIYYSEGGKQYWDDRGISQSKLFVAYNALDTQTQIKIRESIGYKELDAFLKKEGLKGKKIVAYLGRLISIKKPEIFIEAIARAYAQESSVVGVLIGDGPQRNELEQLTRKLGLPCDVIRFTGEVYNEHILAQYLKISSAVVLPAAAGLAIQHAAVYGVPLILGDIAHNHLPEQEIVVEGKTGLWCPEGDLDGFSSAILRLVNDPEYRAMLSANLQREIDEKYNVERMAQGFIDAVQYCLE